MDVLFVLFGILLFLLLGSAPIIIFIIGIAKKTMRWPSFTFNLVVFIHGLILVWLVGFVVPKYNLTKGSVYDAWLPAIICALAFAAAIKSLSYNTAKPLNVAGKASPLGWVLLLGGELVYLFGLFTALQYILAPDRTLFNAGKIESDVFIMNLAWFVGCVLCYLASRYNLAKIPNLARWIVMGSGFFFVANIPSVVATTLVSVPQNPQDLVYAHEASLLMLGYIPLILMFTLMAKDFHKPAATAPAQQD